MPYINTIDINGEVYHVANLTDGEHVVDLPQLNDNDIFLVRGDIIDSLTSSVSSKPLSAKQGKILNDVISQLKADVGGKDNARKNVTAEWEAFTTNDTGGTPEDFAQTLSEGKYFFECADESIYLRFKAYASVTTESFLGEERKMTFMCILYEDGVNYLYAFLNGKKLVETELDLNGSSEIRLLKEGHSYSALTSKDIPIPASADNGKVLRVVGGKATWVSLPSASGVSF